MIPSAAVFAAAIEDAEGIPIVAMPISPSELFHLREVSPADRGNLHMSGNAMPDKFEDPRPTGDPSPVSPEER